MAFKVFTLSNGWGAAVEGFLGKKQMSGGGLASHAVLISVAVHKLEGSVLARQQRSP
jgi:hypothetical protein